MSVVVDVAELRFADGVTVPLVRVESDWLTELAVWSTFAAALLALVAIVYSGRLSRRGQADLVRERRLEFELGLLAGISQQLATTGTQFRYVSGHVAALVRDPESRELPVLRVQTGVHATDYCQARCAAVREPADKPGSDRIDEAADAQSLIWAEIGREISVAISTRVQ